MSLKELTKEEIRNMNYEELADYVIELIDQHILFETETKAKLVLMMAEKLEVAGYPILEIREKILERLGPRVTRSYILRCLPERFKKAKNIAAGKRTAAAIKERKQQQQAVTNTGTSSSSSPATVLENPIKDNYDEEEDLDDDYNDDNERQERETLPNITPDLEPLTTTIKIQKLTAEMIEGFAGENARAKKYVYLEINNDNHKLVKIFNDNGKTD